MKKTNAIILGLLLFTSSKSWTQEYTFQLQNASYAALTSSTSISNGDVWDDPQYEIPLGFVINLYDTTLSSLYLSGIGAGGELSTYLAPGSILSPLLSFVGTDIVDRGYGTANSLSPISYTVLGTVGSRIGKLEYKNVGFYYETDPDGISTDFASFQIWIYESNSSFEVHFGPSSITQPSLCFDSEDGLYTGLSKKWDYSTYASVSNNQVLVGTASSPIISTKQDYFTDFMIGWPSNGTVFKFTKSISNITEMDFSEEFKVYPNPAKDKLYISNLNLQDVSKITVMDVTGKTIYSISNKVFNSSLNILENVKLPQGSYFLVVTSKTNPITTARFQVN
ncbi:MAG: T9SS type A sorting domain-containing protein [Bacteroidetes bacterium]|nr:T9SS type A sorting domain-containing protein [Bacteroidota bacterium]